MKDKRTKHPFCLLKETVLLSDIEDKTVSIISQHDKKPESHPTSSFKLSFVLYTEKSHGMRNNHGGGGGGKTIFALEGNPGPYTFSETVFITWS